MDTAETVLPHAPRTSQSPGLLTGQGLLGLQRSAGNRAACRAVTPGRPVLQRKVAWSKKQDAHFDGFLTGLSDLVERMAIAALEPESLRSTRKVTNLLLAYQSYLHKERQQVPRFLYARYGYVVEELANEKILQGALDAMLPTAPNGCTLSVQVQGLRGMTRPDIIVQQRNAAGQSIDVAWFDITSDSRLNDLHIEDKVGWTTRAYAGEAQYPRLDPMRLGAGGLSMVEGIKLRRGHERYLTEMKARYALVDKAIRLESLAWKEKPKLKRQRSLEESLGEFFGEEKLRPATTKSILGLIGREIHDQDNYWTSEFRYGAGRDESDWPLRLIDSLLL